MKKLLFTMMLSSLALWTNAQIQRGNVLIGANITNLNFGLDDPNPFRLDINPKAAWFVQDGIAFGGDVTFGLATEKGAGSDINYGIGLLARYYGTRDVEKVLNNSRLFSEVTAGFSGVNPAKGGSTNGFGFSFGPGFSYFITRTIGLEALLKYNGVAGFGSSPYSHNLNLGVGFQIYLPGRSTAAKVKSDMK